MPTRVNPPNSEAVSVWLVPGPGGRVRKVRIFKNHLFWAGSLTGTFLLVVMFFAGDYIRLQMLRLENHFVVSQIAGQNSSLETENEDLARQVGALQGESSKLKSYTDGVKRKLSELAAVITSAGNLGVVPSRAKGKSSSEYTGVGGAEVECKRPDGTRCSFLLNNELLTNDRAEKLGIGKLSFAWLFPKHELPKSEDLALQLERYISALRAAPLGMPADGNISSGFGIRLSPFTGRVAKHEGIDFSVPKGTKVAATGDGIVRDVKFATAYGLMVDIAHGADVITRYAHLSKSLVRIGQPVGRGDVIGLVGESGHATGPHLHYEVRVNDEAVDPGRVMALAERLSEIISQG